MSDSAHNSVVAGCRWSLGTQTCRPDSLVAVLPWPEARAAWGAGFRTGGVSRGGACVGPLLCILFFFQQVHERPAPPAKPLPPDPTQTPPAQVKSGPVRVPSRPVWSVLQKAELARLCWFCLGCWTGSLKRFDVCDVCLRSL